MSRMLCNRRLIFSGKASVGGFAALAVKKLNPMFRRKIQQSRTYSTYQRGLDLPLNTYNFLDLTVLGRQQGEDRTQSWIRHYDSYPSKEVVTLQ